MKEQLIDYKLAIKNNFMFSIILSSLFFERVLGHSPRLDVPPHSLQDLTQTCWVEVMRQLGGGRKPNHFHQDFYH